MTPEQKWEELRRHLEEAVLWYCQQQVNPKADHFYFFLKEGTTKDILAYMEYLDKDGRKPGEEANLGEFCTNCEAIKILTRLQWNLKKANNTDVVKEALDAAIMGKDYFNRGD